MKIFTQNTLRTVYMKPADMHHREYVQPIKLPKELYWPTANLLEANKHDFKHTALYIAIHYEATLANQTMTRVAKSTLSEILFDDSSDLGMDILIMPPLFTPERKREVALHQQMLASEFTAQGGKKPYVRVYDATDTNYNPPDVYL